VCDLQYLLASPQPNVSRHLTYLKNSGLVLDRRDGSHMCYSLADPHEGIRSQLFSASRF
jgi:DNA-binding transcriptional ArsR family regulator